MGVREAMKEKSNITLIGAVAFVLLGAVLLARAYWPEKKANLEQTFYSDDDGATWFSDSLFKVAPFTRNGKTAVGAQIYTYQDGKKQFCGYLTKFAPDAKAQLDAVLSDAQSRGQAPGSVGLYRNHDFMNRSVLVKAPGPNNPWLSSDDPRSQAIRSVHSPDGSEIDILLP
jgi:hypothetical protein